MPSPAPRPDPLAAAHRVKDLALGAAQTAQTAAMDAARDLAQRYEKSSRYFKLRAAVVASWALLSALALWLACPSSGPRNGLGAEAQLADSILGTQVLVRNESDRTWTEVVLVLDGTWRYERKRTVRGGDKVVVSVGEFRRGDEAAPKDLRPRQLGVQCEQGDATLSLSRAP